MLLYCALYILTFADIVLCVISGYLPWFSLFALPCALKVFKNVKTFQKLQTKRDTFGLTVMNLVIIMAPLILGLLAGIIFRYLHTAF